MTERAFSQALRRGLGSAIVELKNAENKRAYRDILLRRCLRDIAYDWQSEGTKGHYLYEALLASGEPEYYEKTLIGKFLSRCSDGLFRQLAAILYRFAHDGSEEAKKALRSKYDTFRSKKGRLGNSSSVDEGYQWDEVVFHLMYLDGFSAFKRYATDIGTILLRDPDNRLACDAWFTSRLEGVFGKKKIDAFLDAASKKSPAIKALADTLKAEANSQEHPQTREDKITVDGLLQIAREAAAGENPRYKMPRFRHSFFAKASDSEKLALAHAVIREENETVKALLLKMFWHTPFPLDISPLVEYARSDNELLAEFAIDSLEASRDPRVRDLAVQLLKGKGLNSFGLALLKKNYKKTDDALIAELIGKAGSIPHHVQQDIRDIYLHHRSANALPILLRVYQKGDCAFCRFGIVKAMHHCGVLPDGILTECLYDSYDETGDFAKRLLKRRGIAC